MNYYLVSSQSPHIDHDFIRDGRNTLQRCLIWGLSILVVVDPDRIKLRVDENDS